MITPNTIFNFVANVFIGGMIIGAPATFEAISPQSAQAGPIPSGFALGPANCFANADSPVAFEFCRSMYFGDDNREVRRPSGPIIPIEVPKPDPIPQKCPNCSRY